MQVSRPSGDHDTLSVMILIVLLVIRAIANG
jgi:hypothetical protein